MRSSPVWYIDSGSVKIGNKHTLVPSGLASVIFGACFLTGGIRRHEYVQ